MLDWLVRATARLERVVHQVLLALTVVLVLSAAAQLMIGQWTWAAVHAGLAAWDLALWRWTR